MKTTFKALLGTALLAAIASAQQPVKIATPLNGSGAVQVDGSAVTQPVSAASLPLPSGAATSAKQPALGTAGTASSDVISVQGISGMTAVKVDGSAVTQPVSAASLPLPSGAALDSSVNGLLVGQASTTSGQSGPLVQTATTTSAPSYTTAKTNPLSTDTSGLLRVSIKDTPANTNNLNVNLAASAATVTVSGTVTTSPPSNASTNVAQWGGTAVAADPCFVNTKSFALINVASTTAAKLIANTSGKKTYICSLNLVVTGTATNIEFIEGTKTTNECDTSTAAIIGGTSTGAGWNFAANGGVAIGAGIGTVMGTGSASHDVCMILSAANQVSGSIAYVQQ
ncbi:MAG: hypothetical protein JO345_21980 [Streptosporangiaceae bacterium]|nr:hypothetical protein [Streptosporangiaceae bacterium]